VLASKSCGRTDLGLRRVPINGLPENHTTLMAPNDESAMLMQRVEDSGLHQMWGLTSALIKVRNRALTHKDVKNEGTSGMCMKTKAGVTKWTTIEAAFCPKLHGLRDNRGETRVLLKGKERVVGREAEKCSFLRSTQDRLRLLRMTAKGSGRHQGSVFPDPAKPRLSGSPPKPSPRGEKSGPSACLLPVASGATIGAA
jgi:hypothetical protein